MSSSLRCLRAAHLRFGLSALLSLLAGPLAFSGEVPRLVRDLNPYGSYPTQITVAGETIFFASRDIEHGDELWWYDGTRSRLVADLAFGSADFTPQDLVALDNRVYFHGGTNSGHESELWTSDGTEAGTRLVKKFPFDGTAIQGLRGAQRLFVHVYSADRMASGWELWASDGSTAGTLRLPVKGVDSFQLVAPIAVGRNFFFTCDFGAQLWVTDGTAEGTHPLASGLRQGSNRLVATSNGLVFFSGDEPWVTDGTAGGTRQVADINPGTGGSFPLSLTPLDTRLVFFATDGSHGYEPWITDGTAAGTRLIRDIAPGADSGIAPNAVWAETGKPIHVESPETIGAAGGRGFFSNFTPATGWEVWSTDGTSAGTGPIADLRAGADSAAPRNFAAIGNRVVFTADASDATGRELWVSDGTADGTRMLADLAPGSASSRPGGFTAFRNGLLFRAYDGQGTKLGFTDGTAAGTRILDSQFGNSHDGVYTALTASENTLFFNFSDDDGESLALCTSDGTSAGTRRVFGPIATAPDLATLPEAAYNILSLGSGEVLWTPWVSGLGTELWFSDGTPPGTGLLHDFSSDTAFEASSPMGFARLGENVYFSAYVAPNQRNYFQVDLRDLRVTAANLTGDNPSANGGWGYVTPEVAGDRVFANRIVVSRAGIVDWHLFVSRPGEAPVELPGLGSTGFYPKATGFVSYRGLVYFNVKRDFTTELWRTDCTPNGSSRYTPAASATLWGLVNERLLLLKDGELLSTDGTDEHTRSLATFEGPVMLASNAAQAFVIDRRYAGDSNLWVTDGTPAGTRRVFAFERWALNDTIRGRLANGVLYFPARTAAQGKELWRTDGTAAGTWLVSDLWPGAGSGASDEIAATDDGRVFYVGRHPRYGFELFEVGADTRQGTPAALVITHPQSASADSGMTLTLTTHATGSPEPAYQWLRNGNPINGATSSTLPLKDLAPADAGLYAVRAENPAGTSLSNSAIVGLNSSQKVIGAGRELVPANLTHPNGNIYDQVLLTGTAAAMTADFALNQTTRMSFIDLDDDIVQVEFSGPGTLSLALSNATGPAGPLNYDQAVSYMKGHAGIVITGADARTHVSVFTVGRATAFDPTGRFNFVEPISAANNPANNGSALFYGHESTAYDGIADLAFIAISSTNGTFGGVRAGNVNFFASRGLTGLYAPGVKFEGPVYIGDISAFDAATPVLVTGSVTDARITGGDLAQSNGRPVQVSGIAQLKFTAGLDSHGRSLPAQANQAILQQDGQDITRRIVEGP